MKYRSDTGFTLIELMIVVAIIGILASVAIPSYRLYVARAQFSDCNRLLAGARSNIEDYVHQRGFQALTSDVTSINALRDDLGIHVSGQYAGLNAPSYDGNNLILSCEFGDGADGFSSGTTVTVSDTLDGKDVRYEFHENGDGDRRWRCAGEQGFSSAELERVGTGLCP